MGVYGHTQDKLVTAKRARSFVRTNSGFGQSSCHRTGRERPRWRYTRGGSPRSGKCSFVCYNPVKAIILRRGSLRSAPFRNSADFRPIRGRFRRARDRLRFCARHDYPVVQFMPANDCNLRSIRLVEHFPPSSPHRPRLSTLPVARCSRPPTPSPGPCPPRPVHSHAEKCKTPGGNERFVIGRR